MLTLQVPSHVLMGLPHSGSVSPLSPLGEACSRKDLTAMLEILDKLGYKDDEGVTNEVSALPLLLRVCGVSRFFMVVVLQYFWKCSSRFKCGQTRCKSLWTPRRREMWLSGKKTLERPLSITRRFVSFAPKHTHTGKNRESILTLLSS